VSETSWQARGQAGGYNLRLVNGRPTKDKNSDGLAVPHAEQEKQYQIDTPCGLRVFMLFSQTK